MIYDELASKSLVWMSIGSEPTTKRQRKALYRFGVSRKRVATLTASTADELLQALVKTIPALATDWQWINDDESGEI